MVNVLKIIGLWDFLVVSFVSGFFLFIWIKLKKIWVGFWVVFVEVECWWLNMFLILLVVECDCFLGFWWGGWVIWVFECWGLLVSILNKLNVLFLLFFLVFLFCWCFNLFFVFVLVVFEIFVGLVLLVLIVIFNVLVNFFVEGRDWFWEFWGCEKLKERRVFVSVDLLGFFKIVGRICMIRGFSINI